MNRTNKTVAIIFAGEEETEFNRCSFPIFGRPVFSYTALAALNAKRVDHCFISTGSERIIQEAKALEGLIPLRRNSECDSLMEEISHSLKKVIDSLGGVPFSVVLLLGNSPCILSEAIDNALETLEMNPDLDSVVTVGKRREFNPALSFKLGEKGLAKPFRQDRELLDFEYFSDNRLSVVKTETLLKLEPPYSDDCSYSRIYGESIHPFFQENGVSDIDYPWQIPLVERWLKNKGFNENETPYGELHQKKSGFVFVQEPLRDKAEKTLKVFISTVPFGEIDPYPVNILKNEPKCEYIINPIGRKLKEHELAEILPDYDIIIAGTEPITEHVLKKAKKLKLISRVGIGLDSVDLLAARELGINVSYTPDAPAPAVAELTIGHMLSICRYLPLVDRKLRDGIWQRIMGGRLANKTIGIIGTGRVGSRVLRHLQGFGPQKILVNDIAPDYNLYELYHAEFASKEEIYKNADIVTLHVPLTPSTTKLVSEKELLMMKPEAALINTARGGMVDEQALYHALKDKRIAAAAVDVFENEPYGGELATLDNCFMTCHMGSCTTDCRFAMEKLATEEAVRYITGKELELSVPDYEYELKNKN